MSDSDGKGDPPPNEFGIKGNGHQQVDALNLFAYSRAIHGAPKPRLKLPGDNVQDGVFAKAFWTMVKERGVFRRDFHVCLVNESMKRLDFMDGHMVKLWADEVVDCFKVRAARKGDDIVYEEVLRSMPVDIARGMLAGVKVYPDLLCEVEKINYAPMPVMRKNGDIELLKPGYDIEAKTFTFDCGFRLDETMTIQTAVKYLTDFFIEFPFGDGLDNPERSLSVMIACLLTLFAGGLLPQRICRPMFIFNANAQRSGKSLLAKTALLMVFGSAARSSWSENKEEFRKALETAANTAVPYIFFDNVRHNLANADLEGFVTSPMATCRVMGKNTEQITVPNITTVLITANQATTSTDIAERSLFVNLFVNEADPQARKIKKPIDDDTLSNANNRCMMLSALWTLVRYWIESGKFRNQGSKLVGFEQWSEVIGGIVMICGFADPLQRPKIAGVGSNSQEAMQNLVWRLMTYKTQDLADEGFEKIEQGRSFTFSQLAHVCATHGLFEDFVPESGEMKPPDRSKFGKFLSKYIGRGRVFTLEINGEMSRIEMKTNGESGRARRFLVVAAIAQ